MGENLARRPQPRLNRPSRGGQPVSGHLYCIWDSWSVISKPSASGQIPRSKALFAAILASSTEPSKITNHEAGQPPRSVGLAKISIRSCLALMAAWHIPKAEGSEERRRAARGSASQSRRVALLRHAPLRVDALPARFANPASARQRFACARLSRPLRDLVPSACQRKFFSTHCCRRGHASYERFAPPHAGRRLSPSEVTHDHNQGLRLQVSHVPTSVAKNTPRAVWWQECGVVRHDLQSEMPAS